MRAVFAFSALATAEAPSSPMAFSCKLNIEPELWVHGTGANAVAGHAEHGPSRFKSDHTHHSRPSSQGHPGDHCTSCVATAAPWPPNACAQGSGVCMSLDRQSQTRKGTRGHTVNKSLVCFAKPSRKSKRSILGPFLLVSVLHLFSPLSFHIGGKWQALEQ